MAQRGLLKSWCGPGFDQADYYKLLDVDDFASVKDIKGHILSLRFLPSVDNKDTSPTQKRNIDSKVPDSKYVHHEYMQISLSLYIYIYVIYMCNFLGGYS